MRKRQANEPTKFAGYLDGYVRVAGMKTFEMATFLYFFLML